ncbi:LCP family protein [Enterococcus dongliensis]|uniref:LCP family glycopolymer transferase n=1 Tax=Enterococcus dongliensis TaxID=2559925 RepID=UPI002891176E|nr:LCP family protein [Enterococcus dongliensis]MDT2614342.1 LCP family protein [Enterococcus dongliensis]MDT2638771.1 LCP family protein [Enterococcus dongliensis]MDT2674675.1 LCP family protein [Enterococcus dongliensis]MDT2703461.1 LCP family protein [Enterococcus dongliensis]MDT2712458.1 LCP family protein [Enterococcus dongliensis]
MSKGKKIILIVLGVIIALTVVVVGIGAKVYFDLSDSVQKTYESVERQETERTINLTQKEPFSVLLLGIDTGDLGRTEVGRSDTMMVATVSPANKKTSIVSIARDTYVKIIGHGTEDKINHAYAFGGAGMSMDTVESYLDIPINHYAAINMKGLKELVTAVGGIKVLNEQKFKQDDYTFDNGEITLDGDQALSYSRMRKEDPRGDYGRQERQRQIVAGVVKKLLSVDGVSKYREVLDAMEGNVTTDMSFTDMKKIALDYREAFSTVEQDQLQGDGFMQDGISYQRVSDDELARVQNKLQTQLEQNE